MAKINIKELGLVDDEQETTNPSWCLSNIIMSDKIYISFEIFLIFL
jgi:hypothetical protein